MTVNCSQLFSNGTYHELLCSGYCCSGTVNTCSSTSCAQSTSTDDSQLPVLFWGILGGLFGIGIILICVTYIICRVRSPDSCLTRDPLEEIFEESESHEVRTVTSETRLSHAYLPTFFIRRESLWKLRTRRKSQRSVRVTGTHPRLVCVECADKGHNTSIDRNCSSVDGHTPRCRESAESKQHDMPDVSG